MIVKVLFWVFVVGSVVSGVWAIARRIEHKLLYFPDVVRTQPEAVGLGGRVREVILRTADGNEVISWYGKASEGKPTLLYFHGNGASLANREAVIRRILDTGTGVFMMTYRGFGGSTGQPSEAANVSDAKAAYELLKSTGVAPKDIIVYGESLGSGVAVQVASEKEVGGVVLDAPYTSIVDVASMHYPYLPSRILMKDRYETMQFIGKVTAPVLVVHGEADQVIPVSMGRAVAAAVRGQSEIKTFPGAGHTDHDQYGSFEAIEDWLGRVHGKAADEKSKASALGNDAHRRLA